MKSIKHLVLFLFLFVGTIGFSQNVNIPDINFKAKLLSADVSNTIAKDLAGNYFKIDANNDSEIQESEASQVSYLDVNCNGCGNPQKIVLLDGISSFNNLSEFNCSYNLLGTLNIQNNSIQKFNCSWNMIASLNQIVAPNLQEFDCSHNIIENLDVSNLSNLKKLNCSFNTLYTLNLNNLVLLEEINCSSVFILPLLNVTSNINLKKINISNSPIEIVDVSSLKKLENFSASFSLLQTFEFPIFQNPSLYRSFDFSNCDQLNFISTKNGQINSYEMDVSDCQNLKYICKDNFEGLSILDNGTLTFNFVVGEYCSFTPGGNYNTITGSITFDADNNGCDVSDLPYPNIRIDINDGTNQGATFTNNSGNYDFYTQTGNFALTSNIENPLWFNISPSIATIPFVNNNNNTATQNFCISANGVHPDLEIVIAPIVPARPDFDAVYQIVYKNKGNQTLSQLYGVNLFFNQNLMDFVSASTTPSTVGSGALSWSYANLLPFESRSIYVTLNINTPTDTNPVNIGDILQFTTSILPMAGDESTSDNTFLFNQTVVGSYDPNDITCMEGNVVSPSEIGEYLHYVVNFENTGTAEAENIVVKTEIDTIDFDINSLQMLNTSHNCYTRVTGNLVEFIFQNIMLDTGGHGNVLLKIRSKSNLVTGDTVSKQANIFFDYNAPILTNMENTTFQSLINNDFDKDNSILIYPNPTNSIVNINSNNTIKSVQLYDVQGRLLQTKLINETTSSIDISDKSNGIYFLKITSDKGIKVEKIIKE